ncbi:hypothetical protein COLO4_01574, partial [Corchorus olitorius]
MVSVRALVTGQGDRVPPLLAARPLGRLVRAVPDGDDAPRDGGERHREQRAQDAADRGSAGEHDQDDEGVQLHRAPHEDGLEEVALELVHQHDHADDDQRDDRPVRDESDERGEDARGHRTDDRDERQEEHEDRERQRERHLQDEQTDVDADRVDGGDGGRAADVGAEDRDGLVADAARAVVVTAVERPQDELPHTRAVLQEEEQDDDHQHET